MPRRLHAENHRTGRIGWLRAAVLGANDGIVSTASLLVGVAAAGSSREQLLFVGLAGVIAGAMSMAAGEYVSVSSQSDTELAELALERAELAAQPDIEQHELASIYIARGVEPALAAEVAHQLMSHDALAAHARDELGISSTLAARPVQAALASAASFSVGGLLPLVATSIAPLPGLVAWLAGTSLLFLVALGALAARAGGAPAPRAALRVGFWGALAMAITGTVGGFFEAAI